MPFAKPRFLCFCAFLLAVNAHAQIPQVYADACYNLDHFSNLGDFHIRAPQDSWGVRIGLGFFQNEAKTLRLNSEIGFSRRTLLRSFPGQDFRYSFNGIDFAALVDLRLLKPLLLEGGIGGSLYYRTFENQFSEANLGGGFRNFDVFITGGLNVCLYRFVYAGSRVRYGFIPHLSYIPIAEFGGFEKEANIINTLTHEFFIRIKFIDLR